MNSVFYEKFARHGKGKGLKGRSTHYCPGCGHGLVHKYLATAIDNLGIKDRTIAISPVGCAVFLYYYMDVGNSQAAHGRAPAVALGHKFANPEAIVVAYQGDGDLASIGLAEIIQVAQAGLPITVLFVNNAIYGMTGGQMAPTTLTGQHTTTTPGGRSDLQGKPIRVAEMIAGLDGPAYVERVALYDNKQRTRARKAVQKAISLQVEGAGFSFVEILSECPVHLHMSPEKAQDWVREKMVPVFPLGELKTRTGMPAALPGPASFAPDDVLSVIGASDRPDAAPRFPFPAHIDADDIAVKFAGAGGDGAQTAALMVTRAAIAAGFDATQIASYGPESRGGTSYADARIARVSVLSPAAPAPQILVAFNEASLLKYGPLVRSGGMVLYDSALSAGVVEVQEGVQCEGIPLSRIAREHGAPRAKNLVALGALQKATNLLPVRVLKDVIRDMMTQRGGGMRKALQAYSAGARAVSTRLRKRRKQPTLVN